MKNVKHLIPNSGLGVADAKPLQVRPEASNWGLKEGNLAISNLQLFYNLSIKGGNISLFDISWILIFKMQSYSNKMDVLDLDNPFIVQKSAAEVQGIKAEQQDQKSSLENEMTVEDISANGEVLYEKDDSQATDNLDELLQTCPLCGHEFQPSTHKRTSDQKITFFEGTAFNNSKSSIIAE